jgi:hypothetical protein
MRAAWAVGLLGVVLATTPAYLHCSNAYGVAGEYVESHRVVSRRFGTVRCRPAWSAVLTDRLRLGRTRLSTNARLSCNGSSGRLAATVVLHKPWGATTWQPDFGLVNSGDEHVRIR